MDRWIEDKIKQFRGWYLKKIAEKLVVQGYDHQKNIVDYYRVIIRAAKKEFTEDNQPTLEGFLNECHEEALTKER